MKPNNLVLRGSRQGSLQFTLLVVTLFFFLSVGKGQHLFMQLAKSKDTIAAKKIEQLPSAVSVAASTNAPTITDFTPKVGGLGTLVKITGTNFDESTQVTFGGVKAAISVTGTNTLSAIVGLANSGTIVVTTDKGSDSRPGFTFAAEPTVSAVKQTNFPDHIMITISGTNFVDPAQVSINSGAPIPGIVISANMIIVNIPSSPIISQISVSTLGGVASSASTQPTQGNADLNLPDFNNGLTVIPTPSFDYNQIYQGKRWGFSERIWANSLGIDSGLQRLGAKTLLTQLSTFGLKGEADVRLSDPSAAISSGFAFECNVLVKKISYFDTASKNVTNFNPFVIHPRVGFTTSFLQDNVYLAIYSNFLCVLGSNSQFQTFFNTRSKNVFFYPEVDFGGLLNLGNSGKQAIKIDFSLLINNGDANFMSGTNDPVIPFMKIGFVTVL
jgi:hypothetical protein